MNHSQLMSLIRQCMGQSVVTQNQFADFERKSNKLMKVSFQTEFFSVTQVCLSSAAVSVAGCVRVWFHCAVASSFVVALVQE